MQSLRNAETVQGNYAYNIVLEMAVVVRQSGI